MALRVPLSLHPLGGGRKKTADEHARDCNGAAGLDGAR